MSVECKLDINKELHHLLRGPNHPEKEFIRSGATFGEVYAMAAWLHAALDKPAVQEYSCLSCG